MHHGGNMLFKYWQWGESLDYLNNIIPITENIILVSGKEDSGKTTLKQEIINNLSDKMKIFAIFADPRATVSSFMQQIYLGFGLVWDNNLVPDWEEFRRTVLSISEYNWILLIDDAEKLSWDILNSLIDLYITLLSDSNNFRLILFAKDCLVNNIINSPLKDFFDVKFENINLGTLNLEQMTIFLNNIMQLDFDRKTLKKIYTASNGIIGKVKQLAIAENNIRSTEKKMRLRNLLENIISPPFMRLIVCGCLLFIAYIVFNFTQRQYGNVEIVTKVNKDDLIVNKDSSVLSTRDNINRGNINSIPINNDSTTIPNNSITMSNNSATIPNNSIIMPNDYSTIPEDYLSMRNQLENKNFDINQNQELQYEQIYKKLYIDLKNNLQEQLLSKLLNLEEQLNKLQQANNLSENNISIKNIPNNIPKSIPKNITENISKNIPKNIINNIKTNHNRYNNYQLSKNSQLSKSVKNFDIPQNSQLPKATKNFYILQLMASKNEQSILNLIKKYPELVTKIKYFSGKFNPKEDLWFIATYGNYNDPESAIKDLKKLPSELRKLRPIVRDYNSVKKLIKNKDK